MSMNVNAGTKINVAAVFNSLDMKDGSDGKITASIWNEFADKVGGKHVKNYITWENAYKSIEFYIKRGGEKIREIMSEHLGFKYETANNNLNDAESLLEDVANGKETVTITEENNNDTKIKYATLSDGRYIQVQYDENGEIIEVAVSTKATKHKECDPDESEQNILDYPEVSYNEEGAWVEAEDDNNNEHNGVEEFQVTDGYNFVKYKQLAEKIFGKYNE